nr:hypothetical protein CFP56_01117 [Quercus suber]
MYQNATKSIASSLARAEVRECSGHFRRLSSCSRNPATFNLHFRSMSSETVNPISPARFAEALESLPIDALHSKAAELTNSISHLKSSNDQMLPFAEQGDRDCREAMFENLAVINRMRERVGLIKSEVERRGLPWTADGGVEANTGVGENRVNGTEPNSGTTPSGTLGDDELRRRIEEQIGEADEAEDGVHL